MEFVLKLMLVTPAKRCFSKINHLSIEADSLDSIISLDIVYSAQMKLCHSFLKVIKDLLGSKIVFEALNSLVCSI